MTAMRAECRCGSAFVADASCITAYDKWLDLHKLTCDSFVTKQSMPDIVVTVTTRDRFKRGVKR